MEPDTASRIRELSGNRIDWSRLLRLAAPHGMLPLLYWHLSTICPESVPAATLAALRERFHANGRRGLLHAAELMELLTLFDANGIPAIPYKGPILAVTVYGNLALRQFGDLDILIPKTRVRDARALLCQRGYQPREAPMPDWQEAGFLESEHEFVQVDPRTNITVELHWEIARRYMSVPIDLDRLWRRAVPVSFAGRRIEGLCPEDLLLILSVHGTSHCWQRLDWICDIAELVRRHPEIDWDTVMQEADALGCRRMVLLGLLLARDLLNAEIPADLLAPSAIDLTIRSLEAGVRRRLFDRASSPPKLVAAMFFQLRARERLRDRIRLIVRLTTNVTPRDVATANFPPTLRSLYYPVRAARLVLKYGFASTPTHERGDTAK